MAKAVYAACRDSETELEANPNWDPVWEEQLYVLLDYPGSADAPDDDMPWPDRVRPITTRKPFLVSCDMLSVFWRDESPTLRPGHLKQNQPVDKDFMLTPAEPRCKFNESSPFSDLCLEIRCKDTR